MFFRRNKQSERTQSAAALIQIPDISSSDLRPLLWSRPESLPRIDWPKANAWILARGAEFDAAAWRRAVASAFLDELRDRLEVEHVRWRSPGVEGLAPRSGMLADDIGKFAERCLRTLRAELRPLIDDQPAPVVMIVLVEPIERYIDLTDGYMPDEGDMGSSGGMYLNDGPDTLPMIAALASARFACEATVAHELTHHFLHDRRLPIWANEGIAQMMEERLTDPIQGVFTRELAEELRKYWSDGSLMAFVDGSAFGSSMGRTQEFAYALANWLVRVEFNRDSHAFLAFLRDCQLEEAEVSCRRHLGVSVPELAHRLLRS